MGNFVHDVFDAIEASGDAPTCLVLNVPLDTARIERSHPHLRILPIEEFSPDTDCYTFGFVDPNKGPLLERLAVHRLDFANLVHPRAYLARGAALERGNFIGAGSVVGPNACMGAFNFVNRLASIGHDTRVGSFNHFGPGATVAGRCTIGDRNFFGTGSSVIDACLVTDDVVLGAGAVAVRDLTESGTYVGVPAKRRALPRGAAGGRRPCPDR